MNARVLIVEDHALVAIGLQLARSARGWEVETTSGPTAVDVIAHARRFEPHVVLCDVNPGEGVGSGIDLVAPLCATGGHVVLPPPRPDAPCWPRVVGALTDVLAGTPLIGCTAREAMIDELRIERAGQRKALTPFERLTARERVVLAALIDGILRRGDRRSAVRRAGDVRSQIQALLRKLGVRSQLAAVAQANRVGWKHDRTELAVA